MSQTIIITNGAHKRNGSMPPINGEARHFAHQWSWDEVEDNVHQAQNFILYATALGGFTPPIELIGPPNPPEDPRLQQLITVKMAEWARHVRRHFGMDVHVR